MPLSYFSVLRFELGKAIRAKITWVTLALPVVVTLLTIWLDRFASQAQSLLEGKKAAAAPSAYLAFAKGAGNGFVLGGILLLLYASMVVANEGHWRTFKTIMLRPHRRVVWMLGKFTLIALLALAISFCVAGAAYLAGSAGGQYGDVAEEGYVIFPAHYLAQQTLLTLGLTLPPLLALSAFGLMFSTMTDHTGVAASACLGAFIVMETAKSSMFEGKRFLFNTYMPSLLDTSYFQALKGFANGMSDTAWEASAIYFNVATPLISALVFLAIAMVIFGRRNFLV